MIAAVDRSGFRFVRGVAVVVALVGLFGAALELALQPLVNHLLRDDDAGCVVHVDGVALVPWRGGVSLTGVTATRRGAFVPFFHAAHVDVGLDGHALWNGRVAARLAVRGASLGRVDDTAAVGRALRGLVPLPLAAIDVDDSRAVVALDDDVALHLEALRLRIDNLKNIDGVRDARFGAVSASAVVGGVGVLQLQGRFDPRARAASFALEGGLFGLPLRALDARADGGRLDLTLSIDAKDGRFHGFARPTVTGAGSTTSSLASLNPKAVARVVDGAVVVLADHDDDDDAGDHDIDLFAAIVHAVVHVLSEALLPLVQRR